MTPENLGIVIIVRHILRTSFPPQNFRYRHVYYGQFPSDHHSFFKFLPLLTASVPVFVHAYFSFHLLVTLLKLCVFPLFLYCYNIL